MLNNVKHYDRYGRLFNAILYHDAVYNPRSIDNEENSCIAIDRFVDRVVHVGDVKQLIMDTKYWDREPSSELGKMIQELDLWAYYTKDMVKLIKNFHLISKEYQFVNWNDFVNGHIEIFIRICNYLKLDQDFIEFYVNYVTSYVPKVGVYALSANPFHCGHMSVLEQAEKIFDKVIVAYPKINNTPLIETCDILPFHEVYEFKGLLKDFLTNLSKTYKDITLIRGMRNANDLVYESNLKKNYKDLGMNYEITYFMTDYPHVSSSTIRSIAKDDHEAWKVYIPTKFDYAKDMLNKKEFEWVDV
jgi:phosphopantetheine adenylyltransferase